MKYRHIFWAIVLISIGVLFILNNFGVLDFGWRALWSLWPLILIFWGISILPIKDWMKITGLVLVMAFTIIFFDRLTQHAPWYFFHDDDEIYWGNDGEDDDSDMKTYNYKDQDLKVPYDSSSRKGVLRLIAAAGNFTLQGITSDFLGFSKRGDIGNYSLTTADNNSIKTIDLTMEKGRIRNSVKENKVDIRLTDKIPWDLDFDIGAAEILLDLREYIIDTVNIDAGASSITFKIGEKNQKTHLIFNAGAASISVEIPKTSGCQVISESFMVTKDFKGFEKKSNGLYETPGYSSSKNKITITVKTALSKISINRY